MKETEAKKKCIALQKKHDKKAKKLYDQFACGFCFTEDCKCNGYDEQCDCLGCETTYNKIEKTGFCDGYSWRTVLTLF